MSSSANVVVSNTSVDVGGFVGYISTSYSSL